MMLWPPQNLDQSQAHIIVTIGNPLSPSLQQTKLESLLSKVPHQNDWAVHIPEIYHTHSCHGALFSTADLDQHRIVLQAVNELKTGIEKSEGKRRLIGDNQAFTDLRVINSVGELNDAVDNDNLVHDYLNAEGKPTVHNESVADMIQDYLQKQSVELEDLVSGISEVTLVVANRDVLNLQSFSKVKVDQYNGRAQVKYPIMIAKLHSEKGQCKYDEMGVLHMIWVYVQKKISREMYTTLLAQYEIDKYLPGGIKDKCIEMIYYRYLNGECDYYGARVKPKGSKKLLSHESFHDLMGRMYQQHVECVKSCDSVSLQRYMLLNELYKSDPVVNENQLRVMRYWLSDKYLSWKGFTCPSTDNAFWCGMAVGESGECCRECDAKWKSEMRLDSDKYKIGGVKVPFVSLWDKCCCRFDERYYG